MGNLIILEEEAAKHSNAEWHRFSIYNRSSVADKSMLELLDSDSSEKVMIDTEFLTARIDGKSIFEHSVNNLTLLNKLFNMIQTLELAQSVEGDDPKNQEKFKSALRKMNDTISTRMLQYSPSEMSPKIEQATIVTMLITDNSIRDSLLRLCFLADNSTIT